MALCRFGEQMQWLCAFDAVVLDLVAVLVAMKEYVVYAVIVVMAM